MATRRISSFLNGRSKRRTDDDPRAGLPAAAALTDGKLDLLFAYSDTTAYAHHKARGSLSLAIQG